MALFGSSSIDVVLICDSKINSTFVAVSIATIVIGHGIIRVKLYRLGIVCNRKINSTFVAVNDTTIVIGHGIIRIKLYRRSIVCDSKIKITLYCRKQYHDCYRPKHNSGQALSLWNSLQSQDQKHL